MVRLLLFLVENFRVRLLIEILIRFKEILPIALTPLIIKWHVPNKLHNTMLFCSFSKVFHCSVLPCTGPHRLLLFLVENFMVRLLIFLVVNFMVRLLLFLVVNFRVRGQIIIILFII
jgi:hypothetical protein